MMQIFDTGASTAFENMCFDAKLLENLDPKQEPILHLYDWVKPSATYGYFIEPKEHLHLEKANGLDLARRPTGGGIVFHIWDLAFSFLMPSEHRHFSQSTLGNYEFVNRVVLEVVQSYFLLTPELMLGDALFFGADCKNFCMAKPTHYDVVFQGKKIAGSAQRRKRQGYLHQGTISLAPPDTDFLIEVLRSKKEVLQAMQFFTFSPIKQHSLSQMRLDLQKLLAEKLKEALKS